MCDTYSKLRCYVSQELREVTLCRVNLILYEQKDFTEEVPLELDLERQIKF